MSQGKGKFGLAQTIFEGVFPFLRMAALLEGGLPVAKHDPSQEEGRTPPLGSDEEQAREQEKEEGTPALRPLSTLLPGERGVVVRIAGSPSLCSRLNALGIGVGSEITCLRRSPFGDPLLIALQNLRIALRLADASQVFVRPL